MCTQCKFIVQRQLICLYRAINFIEISFFRPVFVENPAQNGTEISPVCRWISTIPLYRGYKYMCCNKIKIKKRVLKYSLYFRTKNHFRPEAQKLILRFVFNFYILYILYYNFEVYSIDTYILGFVFKCKYFLLFSIFKTIDIYMPLKKYLILWLLQLMIYIIN